jgi:glutathione-regulated potassium-efflux system protein KefB
VVLGSALAMQLGGLSMAMGAFLAGVLLSESTFRHQLEADIEPFRGILLGLFFLSVGMSLDLAVIATRLAADPRIGRRAYGDQGYRHLRGRPPARLRSSEGVTRAALMAQGGEFAFVLYAAGAASGILDGNANAVLTATVIISIALTPFAVMALRFVLSRDEQTLDGIEVAADLNGRVLVIGFGRFGQIVSQPLLMRGVDVSIIDNDVEMIQAAADFGFKVYYGDGTRSDILHAAGAGRAEAILICVDKPEPAIRIAEVLKEEFPLVKVLARAYDRGAAISLIHAGVDYQIRETLESALAFGSTALQRLGVPEADIADIIENVRRRDAERFEMQVAGGIYAGSALLQKNSPVPTPLSTPRQPGRGLSEETEELIGKARGETKPV